MRTLIISHGHPSFSIGGAEVASHSLFTALNEIPGHDAFYLARAPDKIKRRPGSPILSLGHGARENFIHTSGWNEFWLSNDNISEIANTLEEHLLWVNPDVVHFHHIIGFGIETIVLVRRVLPLAKIVITLHEYLAICHHHGQMVTKQRRELCRGSSPVSCNMCFGERSAADFYNRQSSLKNHLLLADSYISPSQFLLERYVAWGLPRDRFVVIDNGVSGKAVGHRSIAPGARRDRFAFFGQVTEFKGLHIALDAVSRISENVWGMASLSVFGGNLEFQPEAFQSQFQSMLRQVDRRVRFWGSYRQHELAALMEDVDWVIVPSIWWENSPVVIQEAFLHRRPLIVSGIGGMAEKVTHNVNGLHFRVGSPESLADQLVRVLENPSLWEDLSAATPNPLSLSSFAERHCDLYNSLAKISQNQKV